ncbi:metal ABC transporter ATP-binding protein [Dysgonomonas sp. 520]|uniref:metal ABC transporter ATP-binding protein n=1 Tax=Dysgonomonas sp. 520 TaxID=2302931 RepID=UPI0013D6F895|nr:ABC transporter ATP-binding protein [Dysgonomonas sp. 520]NDW09876.1 ABC transporter ATP-binding protein [Dysgonomonas sp. 520]
MNKILEINNLCVGYNNKPNVLKDVNLSVFNNDFLGIIGPNGGGKTTLLKAILALISPSKGEIIFYSKDNRPTKNINIGYLPQINKIDKQFPISVFDVILSGVSNRNGFLKKRDKGDKEKVEAIAQKMGVNELLNRAIGELSGGQLQRTLLGRAMVDNPDILILDEPNSYVDKRFETNFYHLLEEINESTAIILVSHDIGTILPLVKNVACVNGNLHYHQGSNISTEWLAETFSECPIELVTHGDFPHRVLDKHAGCSCCEDDSTKQNI